MIYTKALSNCVGGVVSLVQGRSPVFMADRVPGPASPTVRSERPCTGLNETGTETARPATGPSRELRDLLIRSSM